MPISVRRNPFGEDHPRPASPKKKLLTPQARVLAALVPDDPSDPVVDWPLWTRVMLGIRAGYTAVSGTVTRALNGIRPGSNSGNPHLGLIGLGYVEEVVLDIEGKKETNYRATAAGVLAYQDHLDVVGGELPPPKDPSTSTNTKRGYKKGQYRQGYERET